ncbi:MAG: hypothetical protein E7332_08645 [Clostridiales bacterium]|nr:hypothetical protein [Clostridiales bacterium]
MKKRTIVAILTTAVLVGATAIVGFTGAYAQKNKENTNTISLEEAKELALGKVPGATDIRIRYDEQDGQYEGVILYEEKEYEFEINAKTGKIVDWDVDRLDSKEKPAATTANGNITLEEAKKLALAKVPGATDIKIHFDKEENEYDGEIRHEGNEYDFEINAKTGEFAEWEVEKQRTNSTQSTTENTTEALSLEEAKKIALAKVPGAAENDLTIWHDKEDNEYDGKILYDGKEYEFEISIRTGKIVEWDVDKAKTTQKPASTPKPETTTESSDQAISISEAKKIALAKVPGASNIRIKYDAEDNEYEGEIIHEGYEYDFEISAKTGKITEWDAEREDD